MRWGKGGLFTKAYSLRERTLRTGLEDGAKLLDEG